ncbi:hypothetical protein HOA91_03855 [Candidatus Woesearchaeota archaeon]|jgi:hypothetical protein|nr:hypothetical protein [Candidatus Woesearchaeota archaeon]
MGFLDKVMFWKKENDFDTAFDSKLDQHIEKSDDIFKGDDLGLEQSPPGLGEKSPFDQPTTPTETTPEQPAAFQAQQQMQPPATGKRDLELLSSKLDTIKAILNSMDQRIANIERSTGTVKKEEKLW